MKTFITNHPILWDHIVSASKTFVAGFIVGALPYLNSMDLANIGKAAIFGVFVAGIRAGVKLVVETFILPNVQPTVPPAGPTQG